jgi:hypothetical protein
MFAGMPLPFLPFWLFIRGGRQDVAEARRATGHKVD